MIFRSFFIVLLFIGSGLGQEEDGVKTRPPEESANTTDFPTRNPSTVSIAPTTSTYNGTIPTASIAPTLSMGNSSQSPSTVQSSPTSSNTTEMVVSIAPSPLQSMGNNTQPTLGTPAPSADKSDPPIWQGPSDSQPTWNGTPPTEAPVSAPSDSPPTTTSPTNSAVKMHSLISSIFSIVSAVLLL